VRQGLYSQESLDYLSSIETSLLISICSSNTSISSITLSLFQRLQEFSSLAVQVCGDEVAVSLRPHIDLCEKLSSVHWVVPTRQAIQKAFRKALSQIDEPTESITAALGTVFEERDKLSKHLNTPIGVWKTVGNRSMDGDVILAEWINYSGFLASLGGCWYPDASSDISHHQRRPESMNKSAIDSKTRLKNFLKDQCRYLASENIIVREMVSKVLSEDLSPRLFGLLFEQLDEITTGLFDTKGQPVCKDSNTIFVDQTVVLLQKLVERITEPVNIPPYVDFGGILQSFCEYLERLGRDPVKLQIKVKMCSLCEIVATKRDILNVKQEVRLMNNLLGYVYKWSVDSDTFPKTESATITEGERSLQKYALKAMAAITVNLPLQVVSEPDTDPTEEKSRLFKKYFDFFATILKKCRVLDGLDSDRRALNVNKDLQALLLKSKEHVKDLAPLREWTITTISNLLNANVDAGLRYCLPMAYTEDLRTKTSFLQLFTKMLEQRVDLEELDDALPADRIERIIELLTSDTSFGLAVSVACPANYVDVMGPALLRLYDARGMATQFVKDLIEMEINRTENFAILFRGNNAAPRIITAFVHMRAGHYLSDTLGTLLREVFSDPRLQNFSVAAEIDPEEREGNLQYIKTIAKKFLDAIVGSADSFPLYQFPPTYILITLGRCARYFTMSLRAQPRGSAGMRLLHMLA
jgi:neurofibromin 1